MKIKKYKPKFAVLCRMIDCDDDWGLFLLGDCDPMVFDSKGAARQAMKRDYADVAESYDASWSRDKKDLCRRTVRPDEISLDVPIYDADNDIESWLRLRWRVVSL
jgi:hypothetical protein